MTTLEEAAGRAYILRGDLVLASEHFERALALGAVFLLAVYNLWIFATEQQTPGLVQGLLNMVFFLYLVRTEVRLRLR